MCTDPPQASSSPNFSAAKNSAPVFPGVVGDLNELVDAGCKFSTIYADPPWTYENAASRAAASSHYLELYGREEIPDSQWTIYGNQVERRLF